MGGGGSRPIGKLTYYDGSIYEGEVEQGKEHGQGTIRYVDGTLL